MKTLASFAKAEEAHLLRSRLEGNGITAYVRDEHLATADWLYTTAIGGVKVDVADEDFAAATEITEIKPDDIARAAKDCSVYKPWYYARVFFISAICAFVFLLLRSNASGNLRSILAPVVISVVVATVATWIAFARDRAK